VLPNEAHVATLRVLRRATGMRLLSDDLGLVRNDAVSIPLSEGKKHHVSVFTARVPYGIFNSHFRTLATKVEAAVETKSTMLDGCHIVQATITIDGQSLMPIPHIRNVSSNNQHTNCLNLASCRPCKLFATQFIGFTSSYIMKSTCRRTSCLPFVFPFLIRARELDALRWFL
jgi:hypothetical protein